MREIIINDLPDELRDALNADAAQTNRSANETAVMILSAKYGIPRTADAGDTFRRPLTSSRFNLRVDDDLHRALHAARVMTGHPVRGLIILALADHYGRDGYHAGRQPRTARKWPQAESPHGAAR